MIKTFHNENFLLQVITGNEMWVFQFNPTTKELSSEWHPRAGESLTEEENPK